MAHGRGSCTQVGLIIFKAPPPLHVPVCASLDNQAIHEFACLCCLFMSEFAAETNLSQVPFPFGTEPHEPLVVIWMLVQFSVCDAWVVIFYWSGCMFEPIVPSDSCSKGLRVVVR